MTKDEVLKLALEALESVLCDPDGNVCWQGSYADRDVIGDALSVFEQAIAEAEKQEPVAIRLWDSQWVNVVNHDNCYQGWDKEDAINHAVKMTEKYIAANVANNTTPPQRKPLTDEEIMNIAKVSCIGISPHEDTLNFAKVIEAVHGIRSKT